MMANNIIKRIWNQNKMVQIEDLKGMAFQAEDGGHTFEIYGIDEAGETVTLTGTPSGVFLRPDNTDVVLDCSVSDGVVSATLPDECYDVPGRGGLTVFITADGKKTALYAAVVTVSRTSSGTVAPPATQTVVDLINAISAAVATIPASYSALMADIAPTYSDSALYAVGQYAWYDGDLKRCIVPITTAESYTAAHWTSAVLGNDVSDLKSALDRNKYISDFTDSMYSLIDTDFADGSYIQFDLSKVGLYKSANTRIATLEYLPAIIGCKVSFAFSSETYQCSILFNDSSVYSWGTGGDYTPSVNGKFSIQFRKPGNLPVSADDIPSIISGMTIKYYPAIMGALLSIVDVNSDQNNNIYGGNYVPPIVNGSIAVATDTPPIYSSTNNRCVNPEGTFFYLDAGDTVSVSDSGYQVALPGFDTNAPHNYRGVSLSWAQSITVDSGKEGLFCIQVRKTPTASAITPAEVQSVLKITRRGLYKKCEYREPYSLYVSPDGSDTNSGNSEHPLATINKALQLGARRVYLFGGKYSQTIYPYYAHDFIEILPVSFTSQPVIYAPGSVLSESETKVDGYTNVYKFSSEAEPGALFMDNVEDVTTQITDDERHPLQRGRNCRCIDTLIKKCSASVLSDALTEIDEADEYKFFVDTANDIIYFSRPEAVSADHPICYPTGGMLFGSVLNSYLKVKLSGICVKYMAINVSNTVDALVADCSDFNSGYAGGFAFNNAINATFIRCEAGRCYASSNGDGFSAHGTATTDKNAKQATCTMIDCWSHDNKDDGFSNHEYGETTIIGALFEYNTNDGCIPAYGDHAQIYNAMSRKNASGFFIAGEATDGGKYGQMICYNCVAKDNGSVSQAGFGVRGNGNKMILVNCISTGNVNGYLADTNTKAELYDCKTLNDTNPRVGSNGRYTIVTANNVT